MQQLVGDNSRAVSNRHTPHCPVAVRAARLQTVRLGEVASAGHTTIRSKGVHSRGNGANGMASFQAAGPEAKLPLKGEFKDF